MKVKAFKVKKDKKKDRNTNIPLLDPNDINTELTPERNFSNKL